MSVTVISDDRASHVADALEVGDDLWLTPDGIATATGWEMKPRGMCRGERCVPIPTQRRAEFVDTDGRVNLAAFARYLKQPVVHDATASVWLFGESAATRTDALRSLEAPDFRLPDLDGRTHALSDYRGKKVLLFAWASW